MIHIKKAQTCWDAEAYEQLLKIAGIENESIIVFVIN